MERHGNYQIQLLCVQGETTDINAIMICDAVAGLSAQAPAMVLCC